jgi:hypothetical protein
LVELNPSSFLLGVRIEERSGGAARCVIKRERRGRG